MKRRIIFHIDVNSAYLSWEAAYRLQQGESLDIRTIPAVIGGDPQTRHGIVLAKSIPAKKYDIKTGETLYSALSKCPNLLIIRPNYLLFRQCSEALREILQEYSPTIQQFSVDEYFLDYTAMESLFGEPLQAAHTIKERVKKELGFTVNIGISTNKLLAKMASDFQKPDQIHTLFPEEIPEKMWPLPVDDLFLVGSATTRKLHARNIHTIGELAQTDPLYLRSFLKSHGLLIWNYAHGRESSPVRPGAIPIKGIGNSTTTSFDVDNPQEAHLVLLSLVETMCARLRFKGYLAQLVAVSFRTNEFLNYSHQRKLPYSTDSTNEIWEIACQLLDELWQGQPLRHLGVRVGELCQNDFIQPAFFVRDRVKERKIDETIDEIRQRFGAQAIIRSSYLHSGLKPLAGGVITEEEYPMMTSLL